MISIDWEGFGGRPRINYNFEISAAETIQLAPRKQAKFNFEIGAAKTSALQFRNRRREN